MAVPNLLHVVQQTAEDFPDAWEAAHTGGPDTELFIELLAARCFAINPNFGKNGKRGNPQDISDDALNYKGEGADFDPTDNNAPRTVIDVIGGAGGPNPQPTWAIVTNPAAPVGAAWVLPDVVEEPEPDCPPPFIPAYEADLGGDTWHRDQIGKPLQADMASVGQTMNDGSSVWFSRTIYDCIAECVAAGQMIDRAPIVKKHRNEWRAVLGLPALP